MAPMAMTLRSSAVASTSGRTAVARSSAGRKATVVVRAMADAFCRDVVGAPRTDVESKGKTYTITFIGAGESRVITAKDNQYILDAAEAQGLDLPATCRGGICGACVARVASGTIDHSDIADLAFTVTEEEQAAGMALLCMSRATSDLSIETQSDWGYSLGVGEWKGATGKFTSKPDPLVGKAWDELKK